MAALPYDGYSWSFTQHAAGLPEETLRGFLESAAQQEGKNGGYAALITASMIDKDLLTPNKRDGTDDAWRDYQQILAELGLIYSTTVNKTLTLTPIAHAFLSGDLKYSQVMGMQALRYQYPNGQKSTVSSRVRNNLTIEKQFNAPDTLIEFQSDIGVLIKPGLFVLQVLLGLIEAGSDNYLDIAECQAYLLPYALNSKWEMAVSDILNQRSTGVECRHINRHARRNLQDWFSFLQRSDIFVKTSTTGLSLSEIAVWNSTMLRKFCDEQQEPINYWQPISYDLNARREWFDWFGKIDPKVKQITSSLLPELNRLEVSDISPITAQISNSGIEQEHEDPSLLIIQPFDPEKIRVNTIPAQVSLVIRRIEEKEIDLAPEFQRRARVWDQGRKSRLIESLLLKIPLPVFYVAADSKDNWSVVDGLQRLTTILDFVKNEFKLEGLEYLTQLNNLNYGSLPRAFQRRIEETSLVVNLIQDGTPEEVMINIFKRINTGGVSLTPQEIRNALNKGPARNFLRDLAKSDAFLLATASSINDDRMEAQECILRFFAFFLHPWQNYLVSNPGLELFLNQTMRLLNSLSENQLKNSGDIFINAMDTAYKIFGSDTFRKRYAENDRRKMVNKALFEAWGVNIALCTQKDLLIQRKEFLRRDFISLMNDPDFDASVSSSTGAPKRVEKRFSAIANLIEQITQ
ncbi:DUF262 domain-containing protein [Collimonas sp. OK412]|uniref:DUF262 domain-containing protein n=1 Tax=Collimonas sp. (strain OK412) TaxID=1801619 RepID=UPI0008E1549C|nr:DUF262 domain-containing protein [Collimonas sp. OK412]SFC30659.1 Protein of unknown function DUF262 [Collimonas sp. OK412]